MSDLVERTCRVITTINAIIYYPAALPETLFESTHPQTCGKPAEYYVDFGDDRIWMCALHYAMCKNQMHTFWRVKDGDNIVVSGFAGELPDPESMT